jgi:hypothetical protein
MNRRQYTFAGWLCIIIAVLFVPNIAINILIEAFGKRAPALYLFRVPMMLIVSGIGIYLAVMFRKMLNVRFGFHDIDRLITLTIIASLLLTGLNIVNYFMQYASQSSDPHWFLAIPGIIIVILLGIVSIFIGSRLLDLKEDMFGFRNIYAYATFVNGVCIASIIFSPLSLLLTVGLYIIEGMIFLRAAEDVQFV